MKQSISIPQSVLIAGWNGNAFSDVNDRIGYFHCGYGHCRDEFTAHSHTSTKQQRFCLATRGDFSGKNKNRNEWDETTYAASAGRSFVLDTAGDGELNRVGTSTQRVGHVDADYRRKLFPNTTNATNIATHGTSDIDMFHNQNVTLSVAPIGEGAGALSYIFNLRLDPSIVYVSDTATYSDDSLSFTFGVNAAGGTTNIKRIEVQVRDTDANALITTLRAFTCNIGESPSLPSRPYQ